MKDRGACSWEPPERMSSMSVPKTGTQAICLRALHLPEEVQVAPADRQHFVAALQMDGGRVVVAARDVADRPQIDDDRAVHLRELLGIELREQLLQRARDQRFGRLARVAAPRDARVFRVRAKVIDLY